jgi:ribosomal protein S18 acetylase RimI-like enzyme
MAYEREMHGSARAAAPVARERAVTVAPARFGDLWAVARLQRRAFGPALAYGRATLLVLWLLPQVRFLVARDGERIVGCAIGDRQGKDGRVINLCVDPSDRRRGIGTLLLRAAEGALPAGNVLLMVEEDNVGARALYTREGYGQVGVAQHYYGRGHHGVWMQKQRTADRPPKLRV